MSDIGIRFDGLILAAAIAVSVLIFAVILVATLVLAMTLRTHRDRLFALARNAAAQGGVSLVCLLAVMAYINSRTAPVADTDWIDWLTLPWIVWSLLGVVYFVRLLSVQRKSIRATDASENCWY